jgi:hypothetical protein
MRDEEKQIVKDEHVNDKNRRRNFNKSVEELFNDLSPILDEFEEKIIHFNEDFKEVHAFLKKIVWLIGRKRPIPRVTNPTLPTSLVPCETLDTLASFDPIVLLKSFINIFSLFKDNAKKDYQHYEKWANVSIILSINDDYDNLGFQGNPLEINFHWRQIRISHCSSHSHHPTSMYRTYGVFALSNISKGTRFKYFGFNQNPWIDDRTESSQAISHVVSNSSSSSCTSHLPKNTNIMAFIHTPNIPFAPTCTFVDDHPTVIDIPYFKCNRDIEKDEELTCFLPFLWQQPFQHIRTLSKVPNHNEYEGENQFGVPSGYTLSIASLE